MNSFGVFSMSDMRGERLQVMLSPEELTAIDDFRFKHRMPTRAAAVRELLRLGLTVIAADGGGMKSSNYGVFNRGPDGPPTAPIRIRRRSATTAEISASQAARRFAPSSHRHSCATRSLKGEAWCPGKDSNLHGR